MIFGTRQYKFLMSFRNLQNLVIFSYTLFFGRPITCFLAFVNEVCHFVASILHEISGEKINTCE